ncbi:MAG: DNA primase [Salinivirgaceae bacterium]|nr:MAG: DNA primase [Salinivirgaceae bacterium]
MIDKLTIDRIYNSLDIIDVVGDYVSLKRRGANYLGLCPFHNEKTPSFTVSASKGIYKCFGCGKGGNAVNFIMEQEGLSYVEALKSLAKRYNIEVEEKEPTQEDIQKRDQRESMLILSQHAADWFSKQLFETEEGKQIGLSYFKERGFTENTIKKFGLGYSPTKRDALTEAALKNGFKLDYLSSTGLTIVKDDYKFDRFAARVMFPIHSLSGQVIAFGGRIMRKDTKMAKYLNSPESEIYHKSRVLYGIYQARKAVTQQDSCILVEGYTDVISLNQAGIENVVASSGTSLTPDQVKMIKRFTSNLVILYDGDPAGIKASLRGIDIVLEEEMNVKICLLPEGEDPDSFAKNNGAQAVTDYISEKAVDFIRFKTNILMKDAGNDPIKKASVANDIVQSIAIIPDGIMRAIYLKDTASIMDMDEKVLYTEVNKVRRRRFYKNAEKQKEAPEKKVATPDSKEIVKPNLESVLFQAERELLWLLLQHGKTELYFESEGEEKEETHENISVSSFVLDDINADGLTFLHPVLRKVFDEMLNFQVRGMEIEEKYFVNHEDPQVVNAIVDITSKNFPLSKFWESVAKSKMPTIDLTEIAEKLLNQFKAYRIQKMIMDLNDQKRSTELSEAEMKEINVQIMELHNIRRKIPSINDQRTFY